MSDATPLTVEHIQRVLADPDPLVNRLRGKYTTLVGERQFPTTPIQVAAAVEIDALLARAVQAEADRKVLAERCEDLNHLSMCYRVGKCPEDAVLDRLTSDIASAALARAGEVKP